ncbi:ABC transporter ATP-binding protein [Tranquillimonas alkanivorans]|uniref:Carbohydrate ABC transporter ATP-binding protein, CUT1 family n=1 Tax=Tranquillimonas alkanivorans TaxID=441119 RepID=A0A1I5VJF3_9RHOB|nr:sn-glycerol-3-phosphate ABC transporter ATP-binding protein UgpC [Tranquillimonas alkanivorans]SFQ07708.1 carbohydrate ABC transporter ATP-binding protein, CUT1 family [Tranquillimonas alkanivorans]
MAEVSLRQVVKRYGGFQAVHDFDLDIAHEEFVVFVGPSGCGKSTTLRMIAGLEDISGGEIQIGDRVVNDLPPRERNISMVFQNYALYPHMTVRQNQGFGLRMAGRPKDEIEKKVNRASGLLGLKDFLSRRPAALSGGQRQRVAMGRAIVRDPDVFLFDEPLSNLDAKLRGQMRTEIKKLHEKVRTTVIYVTHDQVEAMTLADRIVVMRDGRIEQVGTPDEVFHAPASRFVAGFIGSPPMNLIDARTVASDDGVAVSVPGGPTLPLDQSVFDHVGPDRPVTLGLRPESIAPERMAGPMKTPFSFSADITLVEPLGGEALLFLQMGQAEVTARVFRPSTRLVPEKSVPFLTDLAEMHLFDADTGVRLNAKTAHES